jgi:hypothetical protein
MEITNTSYDTYETINNLNNMIGTLDPTWVQKLVMNIYINDIHTRRMKRGDYNNAKYDSKE